MVEDCKETGFPDGLIWIMWGTEVYEATEKDHLHLYLR